MDPTTVPRMRRTVLLAALVIPATASAVCSGKLYGWGDASGAIGDGVFGLTAPESWGGSGLGKVAMCVVSEELSRG